MVVKHKKKRNKAYTGADAAVTKPVITRITAVNRSKAAQWWFDRKKFVKPAAITVVIILAVIIIVVQIVRIFTGTA